MQEHAWHYRPTAHTSTKDSVPNRWGTQRSAMRCALDVSMAAEGSMRSTPITDMFLHGKCSSKDVRRTACLTNFAASLKTHTVC